jgi:CHAT domain-containing protein/tetratricopeptide (TPR) repeat protein
MRDLLEIFMRDRDATCYMRNLRSRACRISCAAVTLAFAACSGGARNELLDEFSKEVPLVSGAPAVLSRTLPAGAYLVEVREHEIDVRVVIDAGKLHSELEDQVPRHGTIYKVVSFSTPAVLRVEVRSSDHPTKNGRAEVRIARWRRASDARPSEFELGFEAFSAAGEENARATPASWARAADKMYEAVTHFGSAGDDVARAQAAYSLANVQYNARDEWAATVRATEIAAGAYAATGDEVGVENAATLRAAAEIELAAAMNAGTQRAEQTAMYTSVDRRLAAAAQFFADRGLPLRAEYAVNMRAVRAVNIGDYTTAEKLFSQAVTMARANRDVAEEAKSLGNLASIHNFQGQMAQAAREYEALVPIVDKDSQPYQYAALLANYGFTLIALGDFDRALKLHLEALELYTKTGEEDERANELSALGGLYFRMGDAVRALDTLRAAITAQKRVSDTLGLASTLRVAGNAASALGEHDVALDYLRESARIDANPYGVARTSVLIAGELRALRRFDAAEMEIAKPLQASSALLRASALEERARIRLAQGESESVIDDLRQADRLYAHLGLEFNRIDTSTELSRVLLATGDIAGAATAADEAVLLVSHIRVKSANPEWRARFLSARYAPFEARIAVELAGAPDGDVAAAWRGFRTAEDVRARSLADELASGADRQADDEDTALRARLTSQQLRLEARVQRQDPDEAGTVALRRAIEETRAQLDSSRLRNGGVAATESSLSESLTQIQSKLPPDTAVLAYFVGDTRTHGWLLTRKQLRHTAFDSGGSLAAMISGAMAVRRNGGDETAMRLLGTRLLAPLLDGVSERRLLVIADGPLNGVPFAALPMPGTSGELLVDRFVLAYAPSLMLVMENPRRTPHAHHMRIAVVSDPVYAADDRRLRLAAAGSGSAFRGPPPPSPNNLTRLPYSALEANAVTKAFGSADTIQLAGFDATAAKVLQLPASELAVLHFATHAVARSDSPEQSALFLTEYAQDGSLLPSSRLTANEIRRSGLRADVVVLSACATGDGNELRGEGVLGLTYGFLANGSHSVVASLWPIEDASTARFMSEFYRAYKSSGRAADALRSAQLRVRASAASAVWSSFVVRANEFP